MKTARMFTWLLIAVAPAPSLLAQAALLPAEAGYAAASTASYDYYNRDIALQSAASSFRDANSGGCCDPSCGAGSCGCDTGCTGCCDGCCCDDRLWWLPSLRRGDHCFDGFISPMTNPVFFEDPRNVTEARMIFLNHKLPPALGSGSAQVYAMQLRAALTDRLSLIATKDGFLVGSNGAPVQDGWADVSAGLKYTLLADPQTQRILSTGFTFELPVGSQRSLQGNGDGELNFFLTGGAQIFQNWHWISATGIRAPINTLQEAPVMYWSNHLDCRLTNSVYFFTEYNWYNYLKDGRTGFNGINGIDLFNLGGTNIAGNNIVTGAFGAKWKPAAWTELGVAWELPLTPRKDLLEHRLTFDWILRY